MDAEIDPDELQAYADGRLPAERRLAVQAWLAAHPDAAAQVGDWQALNRALHLGFDDVLNEPLPLHLVAAARGPVRPTPAAPPVPPVRRRGVPGWATAALVCSVVGLLAGGAGYRLGQQDGQQTARLAAAAAPSGPRLARDAALAHAVYTPEQRHPVEVDARQADHLVAWLSKRLGTPLHAPQLAAFGYELLGGRLLAAGEGPVAQFMYQDAAGVRLTLYVRRDAPASAKPAETLTAFQVAREGDVEVFYWVEDGFGYALSGRVGRRQLQAVAEGVYHQLTATTPPAHSPAYSPTGKHEQNRFRSP
ncbi:anti-sigma factor [Sphaerotilus sp.]|uniref:anti-sigma factor family protein n=1 Tax=Sphaerotilus sp. TaxID=2093942 RepID=UPI002ACD4943|nr:anti-sigma factor [Sphaerotilus sp.]MDZ7858301.1 anti-sigma factor [Sphaerotilus sp.]